MDQKERRILYAGRRTQKEVVKNSNNETTPLFVEPAVANEGAQIGILITFYKDATSTSSSVSKFWGSFDGNALLTSYRAVLILELLPTLSATDVTDAYSASLRHVGKKDIDGKARILNRIGKSKHEEIMKRPVDQRMVDAILQLIEEGERGFMISLGYEISQGTIPWTPAFGNVGIEKPTHQEFIRKCNERTIKQYRVHLNAYAKHIEHSVDSEFMKNIEFFILEAHDRGLELQYGTDVILGISIYRAVQATFDCLPENKYEISQAELDVVNQVLGKALDWLGLYFITGFGPFKKPLRSFKDYVQLFNFLSNHWNEFQIQNPLNPAFYNRPLLSMT